MSGDTDYLRLFGDFAPTVQGTELKGWVYDEDSAGRCKCYLSADDCREVAAQFLAAADALRRVEAPEEEPAAIAL